MRSKVCWIPLLELVVACLLWTSSTHVVEANRKSQPNKQRPASSSVSSFSKKLNSQVEDLYAKAEELQDRAFRRVYELQEKAQKLQDKALLRSQKLEEQSKDILDRATKQAKELQKEAATNLGELQSAIEGLPIPTLDKDEATVTVKDTTDQSLPPPPLPDLEADDASAAVEVDLGDGWSVEESVVDVVPEQQQQQAVVIVKNKWQNVKERTLPAIFMLGGLAAYVHLGGSFVPLVFVIQFALFAETSAVANINDIRKWWWFLTAVAATNGHLLQWPHVDVVAYGMAIVGLVTWVIQQNAASGVVAGGAAAAHVFKTNLRTLAATALSLLVLVGQSSFWIATLKEYGLTWILYPAFLVIINDTMAYVFGMLIGKHPLLPVISPKKTWEGFVGAAISTLGISYPLLSKMLTGNGEKDMMVQHALAIATFVSLVSPFGGFLASIVKRAHGKKDFATYIPGHGGAVDRLDCQVITAPFVYYYLSYALKVAATSSAAG